MEGGLELLLSLSPDPRLVSVIAGGEESKFTFGIADDVTLVLVAT